jgi:enamine deaminase RidA (YjgF/YER057c/UK114 family)
MVPPHPARSTVAVRELPRGALVEIECIALAGERTPAS